MLVGVAGLHIIPGLGFRDFRAGLGGVGCRSSVDTPNGDCRPSCTSVVSLKLKGR